MIKSTKIITEMILSVWLGIYPAPLAAGELAKAPWLFDAGPKGSATASRTILLTPEDSYTPALGHGWLEPPQVAVMQESWSRSRTSFTTDGVGGRQMVFRADIPAGSWGLTIWIAAGLEESTTLIITTNAAGITPSWRAFNPPAEGRTAPQKKYRVHHQILEIAATGLVLRLHSEAEQIMLPGMNLIPFIEPAGEADEAFLEAVGTLGAYGGAIWPWNKF